MSGTMLTTLVTAGAVISADAAVLTSRTSAFLAGGLRPTEVAKSLVAVEDEWMEQAGLFAQCQAPTDCDRVPKAFEKSCDTVVQSVIFGSSGDSEKVKDYLDLVCSQDVLKGWRSETCVGLAETISVVMRENNFETRGSLQSAKVCTSFWSHILTEQKQRRASEEADVKVVEVAKIKSTVDEEASNVEVVEVAKVKRVNGNASSVSAEESSPSDDSGFFSSKIRGVGSNSSTNVDVKAVVKEVVKAASAASDDGFFSSKVAGNSTSGEIKVKASDVAKEDETKEEVNATKEADANAKAASDDGFFSSKVADVEKANSTSGEKTAKAVADGSSGDEAKAQAASDDGFFSSKAAEGAKVTETRNSTSEETNEAKAQAASDDGFFSSKAAGGAEVTETRNSTSEETKVEVVEVAKVETRDAKATTAAETKRGEKKDKEPKEADMASKFQEAAAEAAEEKEKPTVVEVAKIKEIEPEDAKLEEAKAAKKARAKKGESHGKGGGWFADGDSEVLAVKDNATTSAM